MSPDKAASRDRRGLLACSGPMPPTLAARFTRGELAVLRIVADEVAAKGVCGLCIDAIAARAGVCRRLAQNAIRLAERDGLLTIQERRHQGRRSDPNLIRIISHEWQAWMRRGRAKQPRGGGCRNLHFTDKRLVTSGKTEASGTKKELPTRQGCLEESGPREFARVAGTARAML